MTFFVNSKEFFITRLAMGFNVVFHWTEAWPLWHALQWGVKTVISLEVKYSWFFFYMSYLYLNKLMGYVDLLDFYENWPKHSSDMNAQKCVMLWWNWKYFSCNITKPDNNQNVSYCQLRSLTHFVSLLSAEWSCPIYFRVHSNMEAGNSVKQTLSVLSLKAGAQLPQQDFWKILLSL